MNESRNSTTLGGYGHLDADLLSIAHALDMLGSIDRAACPAGLMARVADATASDLVSRELEIGGLGHDLAQDLAAVDAQAAVPGLEARVFAASVSSLQTGPALRLSGSTEGSGARVVVRRQSWMWSVTRVAAVLALVVGGVLVVRQLTSSPSTVISPEGSTMSAANLAALVQSDMDQLFALVDERTSDLTEHSGTGESDAIIEWLGSSHVGGAS